MKKIYNIMAFLFGGSIIRSVLGLGIVDMDNQSTQHRSVSELIKYRSKINTELLGLLEKDTLTEDEEKRSQKLEAHLKDIDKELDAEERKAELRRQQSDREQRSAQVITPRYTGVQDRLSKQDRRDVEGFSLGRLIRCLAEGRDPERLDGIEGEVTQEGRSEAIASGIDVTSRSVMVSGRLLTRDMTATGGTNLQQGGNTIETSKMPILDALFNNLVFTRLGATVMTGLVGNIDLPKITRGTNPAHKAENAAADAYDPTTSLVQFRPKRLPVFVKVSNQLLLQSNERPLEAFLQRHLISLLSELMEAAFINGSNATAARGILQTSGIGSVVNGTNGGALTYAKIVEFESAVTAANAAGENMAYLFNAKTVGKLKTTAKVGSSDSFTIIDDRAGRLVNGYGYEMTNGLPSNLSKASGSNLSAAIFGNFADYMIAQWSGIEFLVNPYSDDDKGLTKINAAVYYDGQVIRPESFAGSVDISTV